MKCLKLKSQIAIAIFAAMSFTACKKDVEAPSEVVQASLDSSSAEALRIRKTPTTPATGNTYYISTSGNDATGTGSAASPWKTLYKATTSVSTSGAVIHVNAGTYTETMQCALKPGVSIEGDGVTSILRSTLTADWTDMLSLKSAEGTSGNQHISNIKFDGQLTTYWGIYVAGRSNVSIHDVTVTNFKDEGVIVTGRSDNAEAAPATYATGNTFYNNTVLNCARFEGGWGRGCLAIGGQNGMQIYNNTITQNQRAAGQNGWCIKYFNGGYLNGCKIYANTLTRSQSTGPDWDFAIELFNESGLEIYSNTVIGGSIDMNHNTKGAYTFCAWIHDNTIKQLTANSINQCGVISEFETDGLIVENNIIDKQNFGIYFTPRDGNAVKNISIRKNLITGLTMSNFGGFFINFGGGATNYFENIDVYNNTMLEDVSKMTWWGIKLPNVTGGYIKNINIKNNIVGYSKSGFLVQQASTVAIQNLNVSNNDVYGHGSNNQPVWENSPVPNVGYSFVSNLNVVPSFGTNYGLVSGSPLINAGVNVGLPFTGSNPDIGYAEF